MRQPTATWTLVMDLTRQTQMLSIRAGDLVAVAMETMTTISHLVGVAGERAGEDGAAQEARRQTAPAAEHQTPAHGQAKGAALVAAGTTI